MHGERADPIITDVVQERSVAQYFELGAREPQLDADRHCEALHLARVAGDLAVVHTRGEGFHDGRRVKPENLVRLLERVAAALEGVVLGLPAIAVSQQSAAREMDFRLSDSFDFAEGARFVARVVEAGELHGGLLDQGGLGADEDDRRDHGGQGSGGR